MIKRIVLFVFVIVLMQSMGVLAQDAPSGVGVLAQDAQPVLPAESYVTPGWINLLHTLLRMQALDLDDPVLLDEYATLSQCKLYQNFYADDFKWNKVRLAVAQDAKQNISTYPIAYHFDTKLQLDRYDFQKGLYRFTPKSSLSAVNTIIVYHVDGLACTKVDIKDIPKKFRVVFDSLITMPGLPLSQSDAEVLLKQMNAEGNNSHIIYTRLQFKIVYVEPWTKDVRVPDSQYSQGPKSETNEMRLDARLDTVDFYEDEAMTKLIYQYKH